MSTDIVTPPVVAENTGAAQVVLPPLVNEQGESVGLPRLNPLFEAALLERLQFDDDVPELRTGYLPIGSKPAVPVVLPVGTTNMAEVGAMLEQASCEVLAEVNQLVDTMRVPLQKLLIEHEQSGALMEGTAMTLSPEQVLDLAEKTSRFYAPEPTGYKRGEFPAVRKVDLPEQVLLQAPVSQLQTWAYRAVSTTVGRRSLCPVLAEAVRVELTRMLLGKNRGQVRIISDKVEDTIAEAEYGVQLQGAGDTNPDFPLIQTAARTLAETLMVDMADSLSMQHVTHFCICVGTIDRYDLRQVGWHVSVSEG